MLIAIAGYQVTAKIYESANSLVYRGRRSQDNQPVIIKVLKQDYPTPAELTRYKQEYEITHSLNLAGVAKAYNLLKYQNTLAMILEDFGGESLKTLMANRKFTLGEFFPIAIEIADILGEIHAANIIHKDINPSNIVFNAATGQIKFIDFGISTILSRENPRLKNPKVLEGTLAYISPEQTGRMNRSLDYRTDFYSLGITFYELLTHQLPFDATDAMELVHCQIAKQPLPPYQVNPEIPKAVSNIVMKLLAKNAENRYQSAYGIKADLQECLTQLQSKRYISSFSLGSQDISDKFQIPQNLYGREKEIETLLAAFERVATGLEENPQSKIQNPKSKIEMMLVSGYSGIGKSSLVQEIYKPITRERGYFISGKFDQYQRNIPYSAVVSAFRALIRQLLSESEAELKRWREKILDAIGSNGQVIIDVIPEIELIVGKQPAVQQLGAAESQNRFNLVFQNFIQVFCQKQHPLVIFLDDLQWADSASLKLIELIMTDEQMQYLFLIGAYRDNEVSPTHPLIMTLDSLRKQKAIINQITLAPLNLEHISHLIADTLHSTTESVKPLAELVLRKTGGNPFFVNQFLKTLYAENLLTFNFERLGWQWDIAQIEAMGITDNVVDLMVGKLKKLPEVTQQVLRLAACVGNHFDLNTLSLINEKSATETFSALLPTVQEGLIQPISELEAVALEEGDTHPENSQLLILDYKFLHDRVQQAAYSLISESSRKEVHLKIGRLLLNNIHPDEREEKLFDIVEHLNQAVELVTSPDERVELAKLNLATGRKAKETMAYGAAVAYLQAGIGLLPEDCWENYYELTLALYVESAEAEFLNINFQQATAHLDVVEERATNVLDKIKAYQLKIRFYIAENQQQEALDTGLRMVEMLGVSLSEKQPQRVEDIEGLINLPEMTDPYKLAAMEILTYIVTPAWTVSPKFFKLTIFTMVNLSIKYGNCSSSAFGYVWYGTLSCESLGDIESGYRFGKLAINLLDKFDARELRAKVFVLFATHVGHWKEHTRQTLALHLAGLQSGLETGDLEYACYGAAEYCQYLFLIGEILETADEECLNKLELIQRLKQDFHGYYLAPWRQGILNLRGYSESPTLLVGECYDERERLPKIVADNQLTLGFVAFFVKAFLGYVFKDYAAAVEYGRVAYKYTAGVFGTYFVPTTMFYLSLAMLAHYPHVNSNEQEQYLKEVAEHLEKLSLWAVHAPMNHQHKCDLIEAEKARSLGQTLEAMKYYDRAIKGARENGYIQEEALAYERAAEFYLELEREEIAQTYMTKAHYCYVRWGATAKVKDLESTYPQLISHLGTTKVLSSTTIITTSDNTRRSLGVNLDFTTVMKASQAISGAIVLSDLLTKLMEIAIENAGAQKGFLILERQGQLFIEASGAVNSKDEVMLMRSAAVESSDQLPISLINYVARTLEDVTLNDAANSSIFASDPYIQLHQPKSVLCATLLNQGKLIGILYLENNITVGAFTKERLEILKLLSSQAVISLENALLYANLEQKVTERTLELNENNLRLEKTLHELQRTQAHLIQTEKMSSLGQLVAGLAHEINNPISFIHGNIPPTRQYVQNMVALINLYQQNYPNPQPEIKELIENIDLEFMVEDLDKILNSMKTGTERIRNIVLSLRNFSRLDEAGMKAVDIHAGIDSTLLILQNRLREEGDLCEIQVFKEYGQLPKVTCYAVQMNQVFMNILINAIDALESARSNQQQSDKNPTITIRTSGPESDFVKISIADNGIGMTQDVLEKIFDPFFTTKPVGQGNGLGLAISYQIVVDRHQGQLRCTSAPGEGTEFAIAIPVIAGGRGQGAGGRGGKQTK